MTKTENTDEPPSGDTLRDRAVSLVKGVVGMIPVAGPVLAEIVAQVIPQQRLERLEDYVAKLNQRLSSFGDAEELRRRLNEPERIDLFEDGAYQSARALSEERRAHIANIVASGLTGDSKDRIEAKRILRLLGELDDDQVVILASYVPKNASDGDFLERHSAVLKQPRASLHSSEEERNAVALHNLARAELVRLGLLREVFKRPGLGEEPELDQNTGMMKGAGFAVLAQLGRILITRAGLVQPGAWEVRPATGLRRVTRSEGSGPGVRGWRGPKAESAREEGEASG